MNEKGSELSIDGQQVELDWYFWSSQLEALQALESQDYDVVNYRGGYGSGKSVLGARWIIKVAMEIPDGRSLVMGQDFSKATGTTFKVLFEQLPGEKTVDKEGGAGDPENSPLVSGYNRNKKRLTFFNGHVVKLGAGDKWNREAGAEYNAIWCDEVGHFADNVDLYRLNEMLISRQRTKQGPNQTLWTSTGNGFNQYYDFVYRKVDQNDEELQINLKNVVADSRNNPFLSQKDKLKRQFEGTSREEEALKGGFAAAEGLVYDTFKQHKNVIDARVARKQVGRWRAYGYDHGWGHPRVLIEVGKTARDQYVVLDMYYETETTIEDALSWLSDKRRGRVYSEHEPEHEYKFARKGFRPVSANKSLDTGIPHLRGRFEEDIDGHPGLLISRECNDLTEELMTYKEEQVGKANAADHALDALRYVIATDDERADTGNSQIDYTPRTA